MIELTAIVPQHEVIGDPTQQLLALMGEAGFAGNMIRRMADYPPQQPAFNSRQSTGRAYGSRAPKRAAFGPRQYRRTGTLGRNWRITQFGIVGSDFVAGIANLTDYAGFVQGAPDGPPGARQTAVMASKGWQNLRDEGLAEWAIWRPAVIALLIGEGVQRRAL